MAKVERVKKTIYVNNELIKRIKIKSAVDETTESKTIDEILTSYFNQEGQKYKLKGEGK